MHVCLTATSVSSCSRRKFACFHWTHVALRRIALFVVCWSVCLWHARNVQNDHRHHTPSTDHCCCTCLNARQPCAGRGVVWSHRSLWVCRVCREILLPRCYIGVLLEATGMHGTSHTQAIQALLNLRQPRSQRWFIRVFVPNCCHWALWLECGHAICTWIFMQLYWLLILSIYHSQIHFISKRSCQKMQKKSNFLSFL